MCLFDRLPRKHIHSFSVIRKRFREDFQNWLKWTLYMRNSKAFHVEMLQRDSAESRLKTFFCFKIKFKSFILNSISFIGVFAEFCFFFFLKHVIWTLWIEELAIIVEFEEMFYLQNIVLMNRKQFGFSTYAITLLWVTIFRFTDRTRFPPKGEIGFGAAFIEVDPMDTMDIVCPKYNSNSEHSVEKEWLIVYQVWGIFLPDFFCFYAIIRD